MERIVPTDNGLQKIEDAGRVLFRSTSTNPETGVIVTVDNEPATKSTFRKEYNPKTKITRETSVIHCDTEDGSEMLINYMVSEENAEIFRFIQMEREVIESDEDEEDCEPILTLGYIDESSPIQFQAAYENGNLARIIVPYESMKFLDEKKRIGCINIKDRVNMLQQILLERKEIKVFYPEFDGLDGESPDLSEVMLIESTDIVARDRIQKIMNNWDVIEQSLPVKGMVEVAVEQIIRQYLDTELSDEELDIYKDRLSLLALQLLPVDFPDFSDEQKKKFVNDAIEKTISDVIAKNNYVIASKGDFIANFEIDGSGDLEVEITDYSDKKVAEEYAFEGKEFLFDNYIFVLKQVGKTMEVSVSHRNPAKKERSGFIVPMEIDNEVIENVIQDDRLTGWEDVLGMIDMKYSKTA